MGGMDAESLFSELFGGGLFGGGGGGGRSRGPQGPRRGKDMVHQLKVSLEDLYKGKATKLALQKHVLCGGCGGKGGKQGAVQACSGCNGQGARIAIRQMGPMIQQFQEVCPQCRGEGEIINEKDRCKQCLGKKIVGEKKILEVFIDKGMKNGQQISFAGEGDQAPNIIPGDIIIALNQKPHSTFRRDGDDLIYQANIDLLTALAGGQFAIPHLDDRMLLVTILPGEAIQPDMVKVIPNEGMPSYRHQTHGHLFVKFTVDFPQSNWADDETIAQLHAILPPSKPLPAFGNKHVDEVVLADATGHQSQRAHHAHHNDDDDDDEQDRGPPGVQCAQS